MPSCTTCPAVAAATYVTFFFLVFAFRLTSTYRSKITRTSMYPITTRSILALNAVLRCRMEVMMGVFLIHCTTAMASIISTLGTRSVVSRSSLGTERAATLATDVLWACASASSSRFAASSAWMMLALSLGRWTCYLGQGLLERLDVRDLTLLVVYDTVAKTVNPRKPIETHSHEEADTLIPLHVILLILTSSYYSWTWYHEGILGLWQNRSSNWERGDAPGDGRLRADERYWDAQVGFHHFTCTDWGGKFVVLFKKTWMTAFLSLDVMIPSLKRLPATEKGLSPCQPMMWAKPRLPCQPVLHHWRHSYARCMLRKAQPGSYPNCTGYFSEENIFESEMLPPTVGTLIPHVQRVKYMVMRDRGYTSPHPSLPNLEGILYIMDGRRKGCQSSASYLLHPVLW